MRGFRRAVLAGAVLAASAGLLLPSSASAAIQEAPEPDAVLAAHEARTITASYSGVASRLEIVNPAGEVVASVEGGPTAEPATLSLLLKTRCPADPGEACESGLPGANGRWLARQLLSDADERPFFLRIGGLPVTEVAAIREGRTVTVRWTPGPETDVTGWAVGDGEAEQRVTPEACAEGSCTTTFTYPEGATGERTYGVRAARPCGVEECPDVLGDVAASPAVALSDSPPSAAPSSGPSTAAPGAPGASPSPGGAGTATAQTFAQGFSSFAPALGLPKLPPLPATSAPSVAGPQVADGFDPGFDLGDEEEEPGSPDPVIASRGRESVLEATGGMLDDEQLLRSVAGALLLLLAGAHLRTWLARSTPDDFA